jgi:hypothetical protein
MSEFKLKNTISEGTKMFWKYQHAVWREFLLAFYKSNSQMRVFWSHCRALTTATFQHSSFIEFNEENVMHVFS